MYNEQSLQGIGSKIKLLRTLRQVNQQQLAKQLGISQTHMSNIEAGRGLGKPAAADAGSQFV